MLNRSLKYQEPKLGSQSDTEETEAAKVLGKSLVEVDMKACQRLASLLKSQSIPLDKEDTNLRGFSREQIGNFYFFLVAICHQTSPRGKMPLEGKVGGRQRRGWDYLSAKFEAAARSAPELLIPSRWTVMSGLEVSVLFRDPELGDRLTESASRAALVNNLGRVMQINHWSWLEDIYRLCCARVATGSPNLIDVLAQFRAYSDPVKKKSFLLLSIMRNTGLWHYIDEERLGPPVYYHEVRGHLRLGTVMVKDNTLRQKLLNTLPVTPAEDIAIRQSVFDAIMLLSELTDLHNPSQLHYLFWNVFRSCCTRESPHCQECPPDCSLPERYVPLAIHPDGQRSCPFSDICASAKTHQRYYEHVFDTDLY